MKPILTTLTALLFAVTCLGQHTKKEDAEAKKHLRIAKHTTVRDSEYYAPDTIPVIFRELVVKPDTVFEKWNKGFVVWQTYSKPNYSRISTASWSISTGGEMIINQPDYWINEYVSDEPTRGRFLYSDRKTKVTNRVIYSVKQ